MQQRRGGSTVLRRLAIAVAGVGFGVAVTAAFSAPAAASTQSAFIDKYHEAAQEAQADTSVPASITLSQAALESAWGKSAPGNNFFGIKCAKPSDPGPIATGCAARKTTECGSHGCYPTTAYFRVYRSAADSFKDHGRFLRDNKRYAPCFKHTDDPDQFARELQKAGYATDPDYAGKLIRTMKANDLYKYDKPSGKPTGKPTDKPTGKPTDKPTGKPTGKPTDKPTGKPTEKPTGKPSTSPSHQPTSAAPSASQSGTGGGSGSLPVTGTSVGLIAGGGAVLLAGGAVLFLVARKRRAQG